MARAALAAMLTLLSAPGLTGCAECSDCEQEYISVAYVRALVQDTAGRPLAAVPVSVASATFGAETGTTNADGVAHVGLVGASAGHDAVVRVLQPAAHARPDSAIVALAPGDTVAVTFVLAPRRAAGRAPGAAPNGAPRRCLLPTSAPADCPNL